MGGNTTTVVPLNRADRRALRYGPRTRRGSAVRATIGAAAYTAAGSHQPARRAR